MNRRLVKEIRNLILQQSQKELLENDYLIDFDETNISEVRAIIKAPQDSVYRHKFIRLNLKIPDDYPHSPPEVTFVNYDGVRIHPNMYEDGKCCSTILNTWGDNIFEKWTSSMGIETVLLAFLSFLDNNPYTYEPGGRDDPNYTVYVKYQSWITCLIRYIQQERVPMFVQMINNYLLLNVESIFSELYELQTQFPYGYYYCRCFEIDRYVIDYNRILECLSNLYQHIDYIENDDDFKPSDIEFDDKHYSCEICYDANKVSEQENKVSDHENKVSEQEHVLLDCGHTFHTECLKMHIVTNQPLCAMCRQEISSEKIEEINKVEMNEEQEAWIINPLTKRKVKVGGKTWLSLKAQGVIE